MNLAAILIPRKKKNSGRNGCLREILELAEEVISDGVMKEKESETETEEEEESESAFSCGFQHDISGLEGPLNKVPRARERPDSLTLEDKVMS